MKDLLNSSFMKSMMSNPEVVRTLMLTNPQVREMVERNPEIGHIINDPNFLQQTIDLARNPELMREMMRNNDRALSNLEMLPGGFNHLRKMYHNLQEPLDSAHSPENPSTDAINERWARMLNAVKAPDNQPNTTPLPNPWARRPLPPHSNELSHQAPRSSTRTNVHAIRSSNSVDRISQRAEERSASNARVPPTSLRCPPAPRLPLLNMREESTEVEQPANTQHSDETHRQRSDHQSFGSHRRAIDSQTHGSLPTQSEQPSLVSDQQQRYEQMMRRMFPPSSPLHPQARPIDALTGPSQDSLFQSFSGNINQDLQTLLSAASQPNQDEPSQFNFMSQMLYQNQNEPKSPLSTFEPPEMRFRDQLQSLNEMGFNDATANIRALLATGGDLNSAVEYLLRSRSS
ncbi:hypothetical protein K493DRAFT_411769 [Basidiobolus meristosporus CBS 931.73]|uniref:Ubiquilin n=1 Tax=Basidiobolus meristosporus CBS 931.73 TaxID=1314790 RepID=A0A1Y1XBD5_9FUNG|nr:hypothetical protein K493DRAFT_411769 [Basidiobolus meristosporus CBS 931.73]|eukprot:ORX82746.1 hypothetical protein K493DRAFT_411769 [Basidiobolus meristosporus CBS 931.73]